jgi:AcrR family transcriptional regulator
MSTTARSSAQLETRQRILDAASSLFRQIGYDRTTMRGIAERVGVTATAIYWHFPSKRAMALELLESILSGFVTNVTSAARGRSAAARLRDLVRAHVHYVLLAGEDSNRTYSSLVTVGEIARMTGSGRELVLVKWQRRYIKLVKDIIKEGNEAGEFACAEPTAAAFAIINMCDDVVQWYRPRGRLSVAQLADFYAELATRIVGQTVSEPELQGGPRSRRRIATLREI